MSADFPIVSSSPEMAAKVAKAPGSHGNAKHNFPWDKLEVGASFIVPFDKVTYGSISGMVTQRNRRHATTDGKQFHLVRHKERSLYEVGRIA